MRLNNRKGVVALLTGLLLALAVSSFGQEVQYLAVDPWGGSGASGSCLNEYNNCLNSCDSGPFGPFTRMGCKTDCFAAYYDCVLRSATN